MDIEMGVVVERRHLGRAIAVQVEILRPGVGPPWAERLGVEIGAVSIVVEPQTEARSSQSKWPDLGVLSMAADRGRKPLSAEMLGDLGV